MRTPPSLIDRLGPFDLDPCACRPQPWPCAVRQYTVEDNGLMMPWDGFVWMNPPYGKQTWAWLDRLAMHGNGIALVFARTDTRSFFRSVWPKASAIMFLRGRLTFYRPDGSSPKMGHNSGGPSCLIAYGAEAAERLRLNSDLGKYLQI